MSKNFAPLNKAILVQGNTLPKKQFSGKQSSNQLTTLQKQQKAELIISEMEPELPNIKSFIAIQLSGIAYKNNGVISLKDQECAQMCYTLLNADPKKQSSNKDVKSITNTISSLTATMEQAKVKYNINPKYFNNFKKQIERFEADIRSQLSTDQGIKEMVVGTLKTRLLEQVPLLDIKKQVICTEIAPYITIPADLQIPMLQKDYQASPAVQKLINSIVLDKFAIKIPGGQNQSQNFGIFNAEKYPDKASRSESNKIIASTINNILEARSIVLSATAKLTKGTKFNKKQSEHLQKQVEKITSILCPKIAEFNGEYLENNKLQIIDQLSKKLQDNSSHYIKNRFTISTKKLINISEQLTEYHSQTNEINPQEQNIEMLSTVSKTNSTASELLHSPDTTLELQDIAQDEIVRDENQSLTTQQPPAIAALHVSNKKLSSDEIIQYYTELQAIGKNTHALQKYFDDYLPTICSKDNQLMLINKWLEIEEVSRENIKLIWIMRDTREKLQNTSSPLPKHKCHNMSIETDNSQKIVVQQAPLSPKSEHSDLTKDASPIMPINPLPEVEVDCSSTHSSVTTEKTQTEVVQNKQTTSAESWFAKTPLSYLSFLADKATGFFSSLSSLVQQELDLPSTCENNHYYLEGNPSLPDDNLYLLGTGFLKYFL
ncbi:hypothetical protein [Candidatus Tisiphia endosymbiont of Nemotelus uliginosus]|uniref:hypothetical protein n=1 Tax=Candidatus Tisiphia endosymbiont of Nemotelus uliginosus TaxID=3077926 RepID=UPI0035C8E119